MPLSISQKLAATVAVSVGVSGLLTGAVSLRQDYTRYATSHRAELLAAASAFSAAVSHPVSVGDADKAFDALRGIGTVPDFLHAAVFDMRGRMLTQVGMSARLEDDATLDKADDDQSTFGLLTSHTVQVTVPVVEAGVEVGRLQILSDASDLLPGLLRSALLNLTGTGVALVIGLAFATRVQSAIIRPLKTLTAAMLQVRSAHDFSVQLPEHGSDELGVLVSGYNAMLSDIRDRDVRLRQHRDRLEHDVAARTHDLGIARDEAERANAAKSDFLATMSHEIRTPMSGMLVMAELLASSDLSTRSRRYAEVISQSGQALLAIINDILDFAKIEAGKMEVERIEVDLDAVVGTVLNLFYARAREKGLDLAARIAPDVPAAILADPVRLTQVISNLVGNALKFTEHGAVTVEVSALAEHAEGVRIAVSDTGIGIPGDKLDAIFEAFGQADQSTTRRFGGTGLGLAISNRLVRAMGSVITVASTVGEGSTFSFALAAVAARPALPWPHVAGATEASTVRLDINSTATGRVLVAMLADAGLQLDAPRRAGDGGPSRPVLTIMDASVLRRSPRRPEAAYVVALAEPDEAPDPETGRMADLVLTRPLLRTDVRAMLEQVVRGERLAGASRAVTGTALPTYPAARILAADDAVVNREVLTEALRRFGITPVLVNDGEEALAAMRASRFDLVLMDGSMPVLDGFEATQRWRAFEADAGSPRVPIVALTAHVVGTAADAWREAGMDGILTKPFTIADLGRCLATWLGGGAALVPAQDAASADAEGVQPTTIPVLDDTVLREIASVSQGENSAFAQRIFSLYRAHGPSTLARIETSVADADHDELASAAHALKSMSQNIGASRVASLAGELERAARAGASALPDLSEICAAMSLTLEAVDAAMPQPTSGAPQTSDGDQPSGRTLAG